MLQRAASFLAQGYQPKRPYGWLRHWNGSATPPEAIGASPVVYVSLREAREYCAHHGKRLPHTYEWQYAAQGTDGRLYPWGSTKDASRYPTFHDGNSNPGPEPVAKHSPAGDSPFGVADLVGNVWQYTDEFVDAHTRGVLLRGGSNYRPTGCAFACLVSFSPPPRLTSDVRLASRRSGWYFPNQIELGTHNKYFLFDDEYERAGTVGFRCVVDAQP